MPTICQIIIEPWERQRIKHDKADDYVACEINGLTQLELLEQISEAIEQRLAIPAATPEEELRKVRDQLAAARMLLASILDLLEAVRKPSLRGREVADQIRTFLK